MPLWRIPDPAAIEARALAERDAKEKKARDREADRKNRKAKAARERVALAQFESAKRARERSEWFATHTPPTAKELAALCRQFAPNLAATMERKRK